MGTVTSLDCISASSTAERFSKQRNENNNDRHKPIESAPKTMPLLRAQKLSKHDQHHHDCADSHDDTTTAYSSSMDGTEDNSSQLSSCLSHDSQLLCPQAIISTTSLCFSHTNDTGDDNDTTPSLHHLSHSSSFYSAVTSEPCNDEPADISRSIRIGNRGAYHFELHPALVEGGDDRHRLLQQLRRSSDRQFVSAASLSSLAVDEVVTPPAALQDDDAALSELAERAHFMLAREQSIDYKIGDYLHQGGDYGTSSSSHSPIDAGCRSKMMEWSFRVLEFSFPHTPSTRTNSGNRNRYSIEAIQIVSQAFNLIDRIATRHYHEHDGNAMDRSGYKLICMGCLHIAAKTSGLFELYDTDNSVSCGSEEEESSGQNDSRSLQEENDDSCCYYLRPNTASSLSLESFASSQTVLSTPGTSPVLDNGAPSEDPPKSISINTHPREPNHSQAMGTRPPLNILSLAGISSLSQNEYSLEQLVEVELTIFALLEWRLMGVTPLDWSKLLLAAVDNSSSSSGYQMSHLDGVRECALGNLESAMGSSLHFAPSLVALAAIIHALDECHGHGYEMHTNVVLDVLPYSAEEVDEARSCFQPSEG